MLPNLCKLLKNDCVPATDMLVDASGCRKAVSLERLTQVAQHMASGSSQQYHSHGFKSALQFQRTDWLAQHVVYLPVGMEMPEQVSEASATMLHYAAEPLLVGSVPELAWVPGITAVNRLGTDVEVPNQND